MYIGIDLGTTFSAVACMRDERPEIIPNREGARLTPSVVLIQEDGRVVVGDAAKDQAVIFPQGVVSAVKNYMGKKMEFALADGGRYTPEVISSFILRRLIQDAEYFIGGNINGAVITIPAYFTDAQRKATVDAAQIAGIHLLATINEPTAAAICYAHRLREKEPMNIMIYDLGGGTFDVTIIRAEGMNIQVLSTHGLSGVGGKFFDQAIADQVCEHFAEKFDIDLESDEYLDEYQELLLKAETCKIQLSNKTSAVIPLRVGKVKESVTITREFLENAVRKLYLRTESSIKKAMRDANLTFDQLDRVVLVGGSSKIPFIQHELQALTGLTPCADMNPDEAVALGAAIYADICTQESGEETVSDVCSHSIGIVVVHALQQVNHILIRRNSHLPCSVEESLYTTIDNQSSIRLTLTEGEFAELCDVTELATQTIELPGGLPLGTEIAIVLMLDENQILHFHVKIPSIGLYKEYTISRTQNLDEERLRELQGLSLSRNIS